MKEMFAPEKCPKCGKDTAVEHYDTGWRCICEACGWYGVFHFDSDAGKKSLVRQAAFREDASLTDVPARDSEKPQLEKKVDLFDWGDDQEKLKKLAGTEIGG